MSFQDLKNGAKQSASSSSSSSSTSAAVAAAIFEINTSVAAFGRLVDALGTSKDTPDHRLNLQKARQRTLQLVKYTSSNLKSLSQSHAPSSVTASKKIEDAKLAREFQSALQHFQTLLHLSSHRESSFTPSHSSSSSSSSSFPSPSRSAPTEAVEYSADQPLLVEPKRKEVVMVGNEIAFNEAIIEEREQGIRDIEEQIGEANEIFKDLAVLVHEQGVVIDDIHSNIEDSSAATTQTRVQLAKASKSVKSRCSLSVCWWVVVVTFVVALLIFFVVLLQ